MTDKEIKELVKDFPELDKAWEEIQSEKSESQRKTEVEMYRYRMLREIELRKESLPEPEFTKAKRAERTSEITSEISEDMWEASKQYALRQVLASTDTKMSEQAYLDLRLFSGFELAVAHKDGANWQREQFEKNRLKHCNSITNEQAELEQGFIDQHFDKYNCIPTYLDAIEYGMRLQKEEMMTKSIEAVVSQVPCSNEIILYNPSSVDNYYLPQEMNKLGLNKGDKVKLVIIKKD